MSTQSRFSEPVPVRQNSRRIRIPREKKNRIKIRKTINY